MAEPQSPYELDKNRLIDLASVVFEIYCNLQEDNSSTNITRIPSSVNNTYQMPSVFTENRSEEDLKDTSLSILNYLISQGLLTDFNPVATSHAGELGPVRDISDIDVIVADRDMFFDYAQNVFKAAQPFFDNSWRRLNDLIMAEAKGKSAALASYNAKSQQLIIGDIKVHIDPGTDQDTFCRRLFPKGKPTKRAIQKANLFEAFGYYSDTMTSSERQQVNRKLYSVRTALNVKVQNKSNGTIKKLFTPGETFWINEKYR